MKKILLFYLNLLCVSLVYSQECDFAPLGATWYFDRQEMLEYDARGYMQYTVVKDSLINSKLFKVISAKEYYFNGTEKLWDTVYIYCENNKVFQLTDNELTLVFDYKLNIGDTLKVDILKDGLCDSVTSPILDSIGTIEADGGQLLAQYFSYNERFFSGDDPFTKADYTVVEKLGTTCEFLEMPSCLYESSETNRCLRCYIDSEIRYKAPWWGKLYPGKKCDALINGKVTVNENSNIGDIYIYPNPASDILHIEYNEALTQHALIEIFNIFGIEVFRQDISGDINISELTSGVYFVSAYSDHTYLNYTKIIKK